MLDLTVISNNIRKNIVEMIYEANSGHPGGSLSAVEILTYLYFKEMNVEANNPKKQDRDRFVLSKGHAAPVLYATLAEKCFFDKKLLKSLRKLNSPLQGHPDSKKLSGIDISTGSLGQGISNAVGLGIGMKMDASNSRVYCLLGDGEVQEGLVWEAFMAAAHYKLDNLVVIIDNNGLQIDGKNEDVLNINNLKKKLEAFNFNTIEIDGHSFFEIEKALNVARETKGFPTAIIAKTVKGKGVSFMENEAGWHGNAPSLEQRNKALKELENKEV
ncbi:transketolase [Terrisporobacter mayombei]|uniref:Apulose-4-phosphate transketolase subunit A n=1 Tax=Terrisporobacter mayombei TaxID=1541 RepID=A0ABY9Q4Y9_9FIRM|nr:transketolase [Terrisporobacter mayombei]MCC3868797.1 transketolase [Terrisporobacter mayombei]WMT83073.1 Apulose-4-phosphate transketolase subunit A [Terrisporobacter mayombei]